MPHIFAIGDIAGGPMLAHKAVHEGHVAAEAAAGKKSVFDARQIPSVAYTDPEIAWAGLTEDRSQGERHQSSKKPCFPGRPRAAPSPMVAMRVSRSFSSTRKRIAVIGGGIVGHACWGSDR